MRDNEQVRRNSKSHGPDDETQEFELDDEEYEAFRKQSRDEAEAEARRRGP